MSATLTYPRLKSATTNPTGIAFTLLVAEAPGTPAALTGAQAGNTAKLQATWQANPDENTAGPPIHPRPRPSHSHAAPAPRQGYRAVPARPPPRARHRPARHGPDVPGAAGGADGHVAEQRRPRPPTLISRRWSGRGRSAAAGPF